MRGRTVILFVIAALLAGGTAMLVRSFLAQRATVVATNAPPPVPQKTILVTATPIARGQILKPADLVWRPWPDNAIVPEFILSGGQSEKSFAGWVAREPFVAGEQSGNHKQDYGSATHVSPSTEPRRVSRRLQLLRGWSHGNQEDSEELLV